MHGGIKSEVRGKRAGHRSRWWSTVVSLAGMSAVVLMMTSSSAGASTANRAHASSHKTSSGTFNACEVTDTGGIHDESFNEAAYDGMLKAAKSDTSIKTHYLSSKAVTTYVPFIDTFLHSNCGIIITVGYDMATATLKSAEQNATQKFAIVDNTYTTTHTNLLALHYDTNEDAFLGGYLAAAMSKSGIKGLKTGVVGTFGGQNIPTVDVYMDGWVAGVDYYNKTNHAHIKALGWTPKPGSKAGSLQGSGLFTNTFTDEGKGFNDGKTLMSEGADIIFPVAGDVGLGAARAVKDQGKGYDMEWVDTDGCLLAKAYCPLFLTTVQKGIEASVEHAVLSAANGTFKGGQYTGTLKNGGVALAPYHDWASAIPKKVKKAINSMKKQIEKGKLCTSAICWAKYAG
jgi:basic membrane protein A and related proteins